jgi:signal transduction histidine kinase
MLDSHPNDGAELYSDPPPRSNRKDTTAVMLAHDPRNPLTAARGRLSLADEELESYHLDAAIQANERIDQILDDYLTLARGGSFAVDRGPVELSSIAEESWQYVPTVSATLTVETERVIRADRNRVRQLLENLFRNAIDHVGADVAVEIGLTNDGFYVADDGPGIPFEEVDDIFDYGHTTSEEGTGLGLSIVKTIAEAHGWRLYVDTTYEDGAMFVFADVFDKNDSSRQESVLERGATDDD